LRPAPVLRSSEAVLAGRVYWQLGGLQIPEQQSKSVVHDEAVGPQQPQGSIGVTRHWPGVPSDLKHGSGVH
jgi:hypothetical protein